MALSATKGVSTRGVRHLPGDLVNFSRLTITMPVSHPHPRWQYYGAVTCNLESAVCLALLNWFLIWAKEMECRVNQGLSCWRNDKLRRWRMSWQTHLVRHRIWPGEGFTVQWKWSPPSPGSLKTLLFPPLLNKVQEKGTQGGKWKHCQKKTTLQHQTLSGHHSLFSMHGQVFQWFPLHWQVSFRNKKVHCFGHSLLHLAITGECLTHLLHSHEYIHFTHANTFIPFTRVVATKHQTVPWNLQVSYKGLGGVGEGTKC